MNPRKLFACFAVLLLALGSWFLAARGAAPQPSLDGLAPPAESQPSDSSSAISALALRSGANNRPDRVALQPKAEGTDAAARLEDRTWLVSFTLLTDHEEQPEAVVVRAAEKRLRAKWNSGARCFFADVKASRRALEATDLVVFVGEGEDATLLPIQIKDPGALNGMGTASLESANWDMRLLRVDAGAVEIREPPRLGALVAEAPALFARTFRIQCEGANLATTKTVHLERGTSRIELATFLPVPHWTAKAVESSMGHPVPEWEATTAAGEELALPPDTSTGITIFVSPKLLDQVDTVWLRPSSAPRRTRITRDEIVTTAREASVVTIHVGGSRRNGLGSSYVPFGPSVVRPGTYVVEAWQAPSDDGVMELLSSAPAVVIQGLVRVELH